MYIYSLNKIKIYSLLFSSVWTGLQFYHVVKGSQVLNFYLWVGVKAWSLGVVLGCRIGVDS